MTTPPRTEAQDRFDEGSSGLSAFDLRDEIYIKLAQANGICNVLNGAKDFAVIGDKSMRDSLWVVDELIEEAKKTVDAWSPKASAFE